MSAPDELLNEWSESIRQPSGRPPVLSWPKVKVRDGRSWVAAWVSAMVGVGVVFGLVWADAGNLAIALLVVTCLYLWDELRRAKRWRDYYRHDAAEWVDRYMEISREFGTWVGRNPNGAEYAELRAQLEKEREERRAILRAANESDKRGQRYERRLRDALAKCGNEALGGHCGSRYSCGSRFNVIYHTASEALRTSTASAVGGQP